MSPLEVRFATGGIYLPQSSLWLDPRTARAEGELAFVSHAHSDHIGRHREVILTPPTARLMQARLGGQRQEHCLAFGVPGSFRSGDAECRVTLLPAGHILGSAMALVEAQGTSLLYTGDFKLLSSLVAEPCEPRPAEVLVMETTFGRPQYRFPPVAQVRTDVIRFCQDALADCVTPVLLGYPLGKSQEILRVLDGAGLPIMVHPTVQAMTQIHTEFGLSFPSYAAWDLARADEHVLICSTQVNRRTFQGRFGPVRMAVLTGWAVESSCRFRHATDAAFPLSDHADFDELIEFVRRVAPKKVYTLHGFAADFAQSLRDLGFDAQALSEVDQLSLPLRW